MLWVASAATAGHPLFTATRVREIRIYVPSVSSVDASQASAEFIGTNVPSMLRSSAAVGVESALLVLRPPKNSTADFWLATASDTVDVFRLTAVPDGCVVDITFDYIMPEAGITAGSTGSATAGTIYQNEITNLTAVGYTGKILTA